MIIFIPLIFEQLSKPFSPLLVHEIAFKVQLFKHLYENLTLFIIFNTYKTSFLVKAYSNKLYNL